jgi:GT2 family glycosyltransferase
VFRKTVRTQGAHSKGGRAQAGHHIMKPQHKNRPRVTVVITERERHSLAEATIESIVSNTAPPYRLIYLDSCSPDWLRARLALRSGEWGLKVIRFDEPLWPQDARKRVASSIETDYVVFIDNDVQVEAGWLDALVACADETGAGVVGPLYLWGDGIKPATIHMAGGVLTETSAAGSRVLEETHSLFNADPQQVSDRLFRQPCDFVEYHCMLIRTELLRDGTLLDAKFRCVHEHIDTALSVRQRGYPVFLEPSSRVNYLAFAEYMLDDLPLFRKRWSSTEAEGDIDTFCRKWNVANDDRSFGGLRQFLRDHVAAVDAIRPSSRARADHHTPMRQEELKQTRSDLLDLAAERGYQRDELAMLSNSYHLSHILMDGGFRPCGRPFVNHLVGTASVLVRYGFRAETVAAGMLHSVYSHCPPHQGGPAAAGEAVCAGLGGKGSVLEKRVRAYTQRVLSGSGFPADSNLSMLDAEVIAIAAANEVDMHLSGEFRYSGRTAAIRPWMMQHISHACRVLGVDGLTDTLELATRQPMPVEVEFQTHLPTSYRIGQDKRHAVPMVRDALSSLGGQSSPR